MPDPSRSRALAALMLAVAVISGCGSDAGGPTELTARERAYVGEVVAALELFGERNAELGQTLSQTWNTNEALFAALESAGAGTAFEPGLEALEAIEPPPRFVEDHELVVEQQRMRVLIDRDIGTAVEQRDLTRFVILNMRLGLVGESTIRLDEPLCRAVLETDLVHHPTDPAYLAEALCDRSELPGDGYGEAVRDALREGTLALEPRAAALEFFDLVPAVDDASFLEVAGEAFTEAVQVVRTMHAEVAALDPPERMMEDHRRLLAYLDEVEGHFDELTAAALRGDVDAFDPSAMEELYCAAREEVGAAYRPIVRPHFADLFALCPGSAPF